MTPSPVDIPVGDSAEFECHVTGTQPIKLTWTKENKEIKTGGNYKVSQLENTTKLTILKTDKADSGQYTCSASNEVGKDSCNVKLNVQGIIFFQFGGIFILKCKLMCNVL